MQKISAILVMMVVLVFEGAIMLLANGPNLIAIAQEEEWNTYTNPELKFSIEYPANIKPETYGETDDFLYLVLSRDFNSDEEYLGTDITVFSKNVSLNEMVDKDLEIQNQDGPIKMFEGPMEIPIDQGSCKSYTYSNYGATSIDRVVLCEHDDKIYRFQFNGKSILFYYDEEPYNHMINSIKFFD